MASNSVSHPMEKVWNPFNISSLIDLPNYQLVQQAVDRSPNYQREQESKKTRTCFSRAQVAVLEERFKTQKYITQTERCQLAEQLSMTDNQVKTWFQNRRTKWRRQETDHRFVKPQPEMEKYYDYSEPQQA